MPVVDPLERALLAEPENVAPWDASLGELLGANDPVLTRESQRSISHCRSRRGLA